MSRFKMQKKESVNSKEDEQKLSNLKNREKNKLKKYQELQRPMRQY